MTYRVRNTVLAIVLAVLAALLTVFYVANYKRSVQHGQENVKVLVATRDIPAGKAGSEVVAGGYLATREVPRRNVVPGAVASAAQIEQLVATQPVYAGEQVSARRFSPLKQQGVRSELKGNLRALQLAGDPNQLLAGTLKGGDRVDVVASLHYKVAEVAQGAAVQGDTDRVASRVILRDLLVLRASEASTQAKLTSGPGGSYAVLLAVTDSQAQKLFFAVKNGEWSLQLRPVVDAADSPDSVETVESVLGDGLKPQQFRQLYAGKDIP